MTMPDNGNHNTRRQAQSINLPPSKRRQWCWFTANKLPHGGDGHPQEWQLNLMTLEQALAGVSDGRFPFVGYHPYPGGPAIVDYDPPKIDQAVAEAIADRAEVAEVSVGGNGRHVAARLPEGMASHSDSGVEVFTGDTTRAVLCADPGFAERIDHAPAVDAAWVEENVARHWSDRGRERYAEKIAGKRRPKGNDGFRFRRAVILDALGTPADHRDGRDYWECPHPAHPSPCDKPSLDLGEGEYPVWGCFSCQAHDRMQEVNKLVAKRISDHLAAKANGGPPQLNEPAIADHFAAKYGDDFLWDGSDWWRYEGGTWRVDNHSPYATAEAAIKDVLADHDDERIRTRWLKWSVVENTVKWLRNRRKCEPRDFDAEPHLLGLPGGMTLDLNTMKTRPADRADRTTMTLGAAPTAGEWDAVRRVMMEWLAPRYGNDAEKVLAVMMALVGAALVGDKSWQKFLCLQGPSRTGKSTFVKFLEHAFGEYAELIDGERLTANTDAHAEWKVVTENVRLVAAAELPERAVFRTKFVNELVDGSRITARRLYKDRRTFTPKASLILACNDLPRGNVGIYERMVLVRFVAKPGKVDRHLLDKMKPQAGAFIAECLNLYSLATGNLDVPKPVQADVLEYKERSDVFFAYANERLKRTPGAFLSAEQLKDDYNQWADENGLKPAGVKTITQALSDAGWQRGTGTVDGKRKRGFRGMALHPR